MTEHIIRIPASFWQPIEKVELVAGESTLHQLQAAVGGDIEHLPLLDQGYLNAWLEEIDENYTGPKFELDGFGHGEARFLQNYPIVNLRACVLLGWPLDPRTGIVGTVVLSNSDEEGDTHGVLPDLFDFILDCPVGLQLGAAL